ncbi:MAG: hypothetical protein ACE5GS_16875 [Kiloniellaceae bacterium]
MIAFGEQAEDVVAALAETLRAGVVGDCRGRDKKDGAQKGRMIILPGRTRFGNAGRSCSELRRSPQLKLSFDAGFEAWQPGKGRGDGQSVDIVS